MDPHRGAAGAAGDCDVHPVRAEAPSGVGDFAHPAGVDSATAFGCTRIDAQHAVEGFHGQGTKATKAKAAQAATALERCRAKVRAADEVMAAGKVGMRNWADHVQAQTDAFAGEISIGKMEDIFRRTQRAGDEDEKRYTGAVEAYHRRGGSCRAAAGASAQVRRQLARCANRERAQGPVLAATADGMADWTTHLAVMRRSEDGKVHNPQQKWLRTWRAAPSHINAHRKAASRFSAPTC
jgi:hypothetical protein